MKRPIRNPKELHEAIREVTARHPDKPAAAVKAFWEEFDLDPVMAESLKMQGDRELHGLN